MNIRLTFLLLAVLLLFGGTILIVTLTGTSEREPDQPWVWKVDDNSIVHIEVTYQGEKAVYDRKPGGTNWFIVEGDKETRVFQDKWSGTPLLLSGPRANRKLADTISNPADYGLDPPETIVRITERTGRSYEVHLGIVTPDGANQYARLVGSPELFTVPQIWAMVINRLAFQPPYPRLYDMDEQNVVYFEVAVGEKLVRYGFNRNENFWYILEDDANGNETEAPVAPEDWKDRNRLLDTPWVNEIVADKFDNPADYGLEEPQVNVWLATSNRENHEFFLGDLTPDGEFRYAITAGVPNLFTVPEEWAAAVAELATNPPDTAKESQ